MRQVKACVIALLLLGSMSDAAGAVQAKRPDEPVRVFIDCNAFGCDFDYFRTEIPWVDHVRDRKDASVHILITSLATGGGGSDYTLNFIGLRQFAGASDTLHYVSQNSATADDLRKGLVRVIKIGLVRYAARTHAGDNLDVTVGAVKTASEPAKPSRDRWNYWVFKTRAGGNFNGESSQRFISLNGSLSADRVTKDWKVNTGVSGNYNESKFTLSESEDFRSYSRSYGARELVVKSITDHWSAGQRVSLTSSTYLNQRSALRFAPAVEYDVFPYDQSTRKLITFQYSLGINAYHYRDTTIFEKINEVRPDQTLSLSLSTTQPWGSVNGSIEGANYLDDFSKRRLVLFNSLNARLFKGFSVSLFGSVSLLRDQLYLPKSDATDEEILLQRRQLATSYQYFAGVSLSYTFGSIFNNVVNPRFEGSSGQFFFF